jgi:hypothetical protein
MLSVLLKEGNHLDDDDDESSNSTTKAVVIASTNVWSHTATE